MQHSEVNVINVLIIYLIFISFVSDHGISGIMDFAEATVLRFASDGSRLRVVH